jgi:SAM-dependent methyltransferase
MYVIGIKKYIGIDISPTVLRIARSIFKKPKFITMDATKRLKFENEYFDYVFCLETIEHLPKEGCKHLLKEIHRILKPGGKLIIATPNKFKWLFFPIYYLIPEYYRPDILRLFRLISKEEYITYKRDLIIERQVGTTQHINMYSLRSLIKELNIAGFKIFIIKEFGTILDYKYFKKLKILRLFGFIKKCFPKDRILVIAQKE